MRPVNALGVDTRQGFRTIDLFEGDITKLDFTPDVLVVSAYAGSYAPTHKTVVEALKRNKDVDLRDHAMRPELDLRPALGTWVSQQFLPESGLCRVLCVEILGAAASIEEAFD